MIKNAISDAIITLNKRFYSIFIIAGKTYKIISLLILFNKDYKK